MELVAQLENVRVTLGGRPVLDGIELALAPGDCLGVAGPNGSGKTTLVRALGTLVPIDRGQGVVLGTSIEDRDLLDVRRQIGLIGHQPALIPELTLAENLVHIARLRGIAPDRVDNALDVVGLGQATDRRASASSFGMKRRVEIAHLLLTKPRLMLLDEAASGLDEGARGLISALLDSVLERGGGALIVSHDRSHLASLCPTVFSLRSGRLVAPA